MRKIWLWLTLMIMASIMGCGGCTQRDHRVVVYCAQDKEYAEELFTDFQTQNDIVVAPKYDTEANKSVSLVSELQQEISHPRCDVHWNNEILGTIRLARENMYEVYSSPQAVHHPAWSKSRDNYWQAFAERARVLIVNTNLISELDRPKSILELTQPKWKGKIAMAKPLFGTTATHAACLFEVLGPSEARSFYQQLLANQVQVVPGNKQVAVGVSEGRYAIGMTDTDDAVIELNAGKPVAIIFPDAHGHQAFPRLGTLYIPNTLAIVKGCPNPEGAKKLIDYLLSPKSETRLAQGFGFQFPVHPEVTIKPHPALKTRHEIQRMDVDFEKAADLWVESQRFLRETFTP